MDKDCLCQPCFLIGACWLSIDAGIAGLVQSNLSLFPFFFFLGYDLVLRGFAFEKEW